MSPEQVRWGLEHLDLTEARLKELGASGLFPPVKTSCADHEGSGMVKFEQWDGKEFKSLTPFMAGDRALVTRWSRKAPPSTRRKRRSRCAIAARKGSRPHGPGGLDAGTGRAGGADRAFGQQHRGHLRPRDTGPARRFAAGAERPHRRAAGRERRRQDDDAQGDIESALGRARRRHQGHDRIRRQAGRQADAERAGPPRRLPGDGRTSLLRPPDGRRESADRSVHPQGLARRDPRPRWKRSITISRA